MINREIKFEELSTEKVAGLTNEQLKEYISDGWTFKELIDVRNTCIKILESIK